MSWWEWLILLFVLGYIYTNLKDHIEEVVERNRFILMRDIKDMLDERLDRLPDLGMGSLDDD